MGCPCLTLSRRWGQAETLDGHLGYPWTEMGILVSSHSHGGNASPSDRSRAAGTVWNVDASDLLSQDLQNSAALVGALQQCCILSYH